MSLLTVIVMGVVAWQVAFWPPLPPESGARDATAPTSTTTPEVKLPYVYFIGDSIMGGSLMNDGPEWPTLVGDLRGWHVAVNAVGGSGFLNDGQGRRFGKRVPEMIDEAGPEPDMVVIGGGINDVGRYSNAEIADAASLLIDRLEKAWPSADFVLLSPWANANPGDSTVSLSKSLARIARRDGEIRFIDVSRLFEGRKDLIGTDGVHPTQEGHRFIAKEMARLLPDPGPAAW